VCEDVIKKKRNLKLVRMHTRVKLHGKILFVSVIMVALLVTNFAFAYWSDTFNTLIGPFTIGKHYENDVLVFTLETPVQMGEDDTIFLWLDFEPSSPFADGSVWVDRDDWGYVDIIGGPQNKPPWITVDTDVHSLSIGIAINRNGSPLGSEPFYRFALSGEMDTCVFFYPKWLEDSFSPLDTSEWIEEVLIPVSVIPVTPFGTAGDLMLIVFAYMTYIKIRQ